MDIFKERIDPAIQASGKTDRDIEKELGLTRGTISKWRKNGIKSYMSCIIELARCLGVSAAYLLGETDEKNTPPIEIGVELSEEERQLIDIFRDGPEGLKEAFRMMMAGAKAQKNHPQDK